ncbi:MAG: hypothetical protein WBQ36_06945 [Desulfobaccales bacterium]
MLNEIKDFIRFTYPFYLLLDLRNTWKDKTSLNKWENDGRPIPPPHIVKRLAVQEYGNKFALTTFIETGTYIGDMIYGMRKTFNNIYSMELNEKLYLKVLKKLHRFPHIKIFHGDSGELFPKILENITQPCLFWLDAHYSGGITSKGSIETPIIKELTSIITHSVKTHCILIDDARCFIGDNDYPTLDILRGFIQTKRPDSTFEIKDDIIRISFES